MQAREFIKSDHRGLNRQGYRFESLEICEFRRVVDAALRRIWGGHSDTQYVLGTECVFSDCSSESRVDTSR